MVVLILDVFKGYIFIFPWSTILFVSEPITLTFEMQIYILMAHFKIEMAHIHENMVKINSFFYKIKL